MKNLTLACLVSLFMFACGGVDDMTNEDNYPLQVTRSLDSHGVEHVETKRLPFDYDLYGQAQEALSSSPPPSRYGISSAVPGNGNDTRCPVGGFTSGTNFCELVGTKHINWTIRFLDHSHDAEFGIDMPHYVSLGILQGAQDVSTTGFVAELDNPTRGTDGKINWGTCSAGFMCESSNDGPTVLQGGQRIRLSTPASYFISLDAPKLLTDIGGFDNTSKAFLVMNMVSHEEGHADGFGHVPSTENNLDVMNGEINNTHLQQKHLSSTEKSQLTSWMTF